jgi:hypothetical protein
MLARTEGKQCTTYTAVNIRAEGLLVEARCLLGLEKACL